MFCVLLLAATVYARSLSQPFLPYQRTDAPIEQRVADLLSRMTLKEKVRQLDMYAGAPLVDKRVDNTHAARGAHLVESAALKAFGNLGVGSIHDMYPDPRLANEVQQWVMSHNRLHIPALMIEEGVHGYLGLDQTVFPHSINLATTWDVNLANWTGAAIGSEARANGIDMLLCPVLDVARDPRWGRVEEGFGEDPYLIGAFGAAYVKGMQGHGDMVAEPKHFAGHGAPEAGLNTSPVHAGEREVRSVLLRSFEPAVRESHALGIMAAYHEIDGVPCAGNPWLLTQVLRKEWGFKGFVLSDLGAIGELYYRHHVAATPADAVLMALRAGVDMQFYDFPHDTYQNAIIEGVRTGRVPIAVVDQAASRVLRIKLELGLFMNPFATDDAIKRARERALHRDLALDVAEKSMCLLRNEGHLLPLSKRLHRIAVIGPNAAVMRLGDYATPPATPPPSMLDEVKHLVSPGTEVTFNNGSDIPSASAAVNGADVAILGLGEREGISGEGSDRSDLNLPGNQEQLLEAVAATGVPVVLVLQNGRPLTIPWAAEHVPAILEAWYPGERGGLAIAETLFGDNNPAGRLPISFPRSVGALPDYYNHGPSRDGRYVDGSGDALYPFGHGLSYGSFRYSRLSAIVTGPVSVTVSVDISNTGGRAGDEVAQLYLRPETSSVEVPVLALKGFKRIHLSPGQTRMVTFQLGRRELEIWGANRQWTVEDGDYTVTVGGSSVGGLRTRFRLGHGG